VTYLLHNQEFHRSYYCGLWLSKGNPLEHDDVSSQRKTFATSELPTSRHSRKPTIQLTFDKQTNKQEILSDSPKDIRTISHHILIDGQGNTEMGS